MAEDPLPPDVLTLRHTDGVCAERCAGHEFEIVFDPEVDPPAPIGFLSPREDADGTLGDVVWSWLKGAGLPEVVVTIGATEGDVGVLRAAFAARD